MSSGWTAVLVAVALTAAGPAAADTVCRANELGTVRCPDPGLRPMPRPIYRQPVQGLDRVRAKPEIDNPNPDFIGSQDLNRLGDVLTGGSVGAGSCSTDTLGNM